MKKLVSASVTVLGVCASMIVCSPAFGQAAGAAGTSTQTKPCGAITIKDAAEYNAYANATSQSTPQAKAQAIEAFLKQYPNSVAKVDLLQQLMAANQQISPQATLDAAKQLLQVDPNNLRALTFAVYLETSQAHGNQQMLDDAASLAQKGLAAPKDTCMSDADYQKVKDAATPIFYRAIGMDAMAKKDYAGEIQAFTKELQSYKNPQETTQVPALLDTYYLGNAYLQQDPQHQNADDLKNAIWFLTRFSAFAKPPYQQQAENAAVYWYKKYHCSATDAACINGNPPPGFSDIQQLASQPANIFPTSAYNPTPAPPPPSPADLAHQGIVNTAGCEGVTPAPPAAAAPGAPAPATPAAAPAPAAPAAAPSKTCLDNLNNNMALGDKEFILTNGTAADQQLVWSVMNGKTAEVPGVVVSATRESVQLAVSQDAQQSNTADFTINMKPVLKEAPAPGTKVSYIATFDSYTPKPLMIIMKDGALPPSEHHRAAPHHAVHHTAR